MPITLLFESTAPDGTRRLFDGTSEHIYVLEPDATDWTQITPPSMGEAGAKWKAAALQDYVVFTNDVDKVQIYNLDGASFGPITDLDTLATTPPYNPLTKARIVVSFSGFIILMNVVESDVRYSSRIRWCDLNEPDSWIANPGSSLAGWQDLDYGDDILAAEVLGGSLMIYTSRSIWRMFVATSDAGVFGFQKVYSDNKNQKGCLAYPDTVASDGLGHYYMGRDGIYRYSPYTLEPERQKWIHDSSAIIFDDSYDMVIDASRCTEPIAYFRSDRNEVWFCWPDATSEAGNNHTLCCNVQHKTCDYMDAGFTALCSFTPSSECKTVGTYFVGASSVDWSLKQIGGVFHRSYYSLQNGDQIEAEIPEGAIPYNEGYNSILRGEVPAGHSDREKTLRRISIEHDTAEDATLNWLRLRIGNSAKAADVNADDSRCSVQWRRFDNQDLTCPNAQTMSQLKAQNLKPDGDTEWAIYEQNYRLYYELSIEGKTGPAVGADTAWSRIDFELMPMQSQR